jgi:hypothetical protein
MGCEGGRGGTRKAKSRPRPRPLDCPPPTSARPFLLGLSCARDRRLRRRGGKGRWGDDRENTKTALCTRESAPRTYKRALLCAHGGFLLLHLVLLCCVTLLGEERSETGERGNPSPSPLSSRHSRSSPLLAPHCARATCVVGAARPAHAPSPHTTSVSPCSRLTGRGEWAPRGMRLGLPPPGPTHPRHAPPQTTRGRREPHEGGEAGGGERAGGNGTARGHLTAVGVPGGTGKQKDGCGEGGVGRETRAAPYTKGARAGAPTLRR